MAVLTRVRGLIVSERHQRWQPHPGAVTGFAGIAGHGMRRRFVPNTVASAGYAGADDGLLMGKRQYQGQPGVDRMTAFAQIRGLRMVRPFAGNTPGQAVMTACSGACLGGDAAVIETDLPPIGDTGVTAVTGIGGGHMIGAFAHANDVVVAIGAGFTGLIVGEW